MCDFFDASESLDDMYAFEETTKEDKTNNDNNYNFDINRESDENGAEDDVF